MQEIYERADWLAEMEELGEAKPHRQVIHFQIAERFVSFKFESEQRNRFGVLVLTRMHFETETRNGVVRCLTLV